MTKELEILRAEADSFYSKNEYQNAIDVLERIIGQEKQNADLFEKLAMSYFHLGKLEKCIDNLTKALLIEPNNPYRYSSRAFVRNGFNDVEGAIEDYQKAIHLDPKDAIAHNNLGLLLEKQGFEKQAESSFNKADNLAPEFFQNQHENKSEKQAENLEINNENSSKKLSEKVDDSKLETVKKVFTSKQHFFEFIDFVKNGFKLKK